MGKIKKFAEIVETELTEYAKREGEEVREGNQITDYMISLSGATETVRRCRGKYTREEKEIRIKYFSDDIDKLDYVDGKSDWIDLRVSERVELKKGEFKLIPLGIAMQLPDGYEAHLVPRSSTFKNWGIIQTNSVGIIDGSYCGDNDMWKMPVYATRDTVIDVNDRVAQFRIVENQPKIRFVETDRLSNADRGGFGSTGIQ